MFTENHKNPFKLLKEMDERSRLSATEAVFHEQADNAWRGIGFLVDGQRLIAPMGEVEEVIRVPACTKLPGVKPWLNGVANIRGRLLSVVDLGAFFGEQSAISSHKRRVLIIKLGDIYTGVIVREVLGLHSFSEGMSREGVEIGARFKPYVEGKFEVDNESWTVFSLFKLVQAPAFLQVAL